MPTSKNSTSNINSARHAPALKNQQPFTGVPWHNAWPDIMSALPVEKWIDRMPLNNKSWIDEVVLPPGAKQRITLRIDEDLLDFFRQTGKRYQSRINAVLRSYVDAQRKRQG